MDRGAICNSLVRVQGTIQRRFLRVVEEPQQLLSDARHARRAAHEHDLVHLRLAELGVAQHLLDGLHARAEVVRVPVGNGKVLGLRENENLSP